MKPKSMAVLLAATALTAGVATRATAQPADPESPSGDRGSRAQARELPDRLDLPAGFAPEGITAGRRFDLYVGSIPTGAVARIDARTGATRTVVRGRPGRAAIGLKLDRRERLFVAGGPTGKAFVYDARTGADEREFQLAAPGDADTFVNDVALTRPTAYFTDSRRSQIYAVSRSLRRSQTITLRDIPDEPGNNLNGIVATPSENRLIAVQSNAGRLWRINPATGRSVQIDLGGQTVTMGDGLLLEGRTLYVVQNRIDTITVIRMNAKYSAGTVVTRILPTDVDVPTTITFLRGELYAVNARFGTTDPQPAKYWVTRVRR